jgi:hypothetical protein
MTIFYMDPDRGDNSNPGTHQEPLKDFDGFYEKCKAENIERANLMHDSATVTMWPVDEEMQGLLNMAYGRYQEVRGARNDGQPTPD